MSTPPAHDPRSAPPDRPSAPPAAAAPARRRMPTLTLGALVVGTAATTWASPDPAGPGAPPAGAQAPAWVVQEVTEEELGRLLFFDPVLSGEKDVACATCHHPDFAWADGRELSLGPGAVGLGPERRDLSGGRIPVVKRNAPTILNVALNGLDRQRRRRGADRTEPTPSVDRVDQARSPMFWDNRVRSLEAQALKPLEAREEMRGDAYPEAVAVDSVVARLAAIPGYVDLFEGVYGPGPVDAERLAAALAAFQRTLLAMNAPIDRYRAGDRDALTAEQIRGMEVFDDVGCDRCHEGPMFSDFRLHAEGVREHPALAEPDSGGGRFRFRTPSLRNVALTAPYMHNGVLATLEDVLRFYDEGRSENPFVTTGRRGGRDRDRGDDAVGPAVPGSVDAAASAPRPGRLDGRFRGVDDMSEREMREIVAFLEALTDPDFDRTVPARVPSGLPPGGSPGG